MSHLHFEWPWKLWNIKTYEMSHSRINLRPKRHCSRLATNFNDGLFSQCSKNELFCSMIRGNINKMCKAKCKWCINVGYSIFPIQVPYKCALTSERALQPSSFVGFRFFNLIKLNAKDGFGQPLTYNKCFIVFTHERRWICFWKVSCWRGRVVKS